MTDSDAFLERVGKKSKCVEKWVCMWVSIRLATSGESLLVTTLQAKGDSAISGVDSSNSRDIKQGIFFHVCRAKARHAFNSVGSGVVLLFEEGFVVFRVKGGPGVGHGHVNKSSVASVFEEVNFLDHFLE